MVSRLMLGAGLLLLAITSHSFAVASLLVALAGIIIRILDDNWITTLRLLRLLRWFVIPILLLHLLFTPGQLLMPGWPIPVSREGLIQGLWLSLHLAAIYSVAMLMFRLLRQYEWLALLILLPTCGERLLIQALMLISMKKQMTELLLHLQQRYRLRHDWKKLPLLFMAAFSRSLADAKAHAQALWLRWPQHPSSIFATIGEKNSAPVLYRWLLSTLWAVCGGAGLLFPWFR